MITGKLYDRLKFLAQVVLPAVATLYVTLAGLWGLPAVEAVVGTIVAFDTFLGVVLQISSSNYNSSTASGTLGIHETEEGKVYNLEIHNDPELELDGKDRVVFNVKKMKADPPPPTHPPRKTPARRRRAADT
jgi:Putative phage holin Dp-1